MNDEDLEARLRDWGEQRRAAAPPVRVPQDRFARRPRHLLPAVAAAAAVLAVGGGIAAVQLSGDRTRTPSGQRTGAAGSATPSPTSTAVPAGYRRVVFHGLAIDVPSSWPSGAVRCGVPIQDTFVLPGPQTACAIQPTPPVTSVVFSEGAPSNVPVNGTRTERIRLDGTPATRTTAALGRNYVISVSVPSIVAGVTIQSPSRRTADALAASLTVVGTDANGCIARTDAVARLPTGKPPARPGAEQQLVPGVPDRVTICRYLGGFLEQSATLDGTQTRSLLSTLDALPPGVSIADKRTFAQYLCRSGTGAGSVLGDQAGDSEGYLVHADFRTGPSVAVVVRLSLCGELGASNGTRTGQRTAPLVELVATLAGASQAIPPARTK